MEGKTMGELDMTDAEEEADVEDLLQYLVAKCRYESLQAHHEETKEVLARIEESIHPIIDLVIADYEAWIKSAECQDQLWEVEIYVLSDDTEGRTCFIEVQAPTAKEALCKAITGFELRREEQFTHISVSGPRNKKLHDLIEEADRDIAAGNYREL